MAKKKIDKERPVKATTRQSKTAKRGSRKNPQTDTNKATPGNECISIPSARQGSRDQREDDDLASFHRRILNEAMPRIHAATVPIYGVQNEQVRKNRTGVLFRIADRHFIFTAAHDLRKIIREDIQLYVDFSRTHRVPIPLGGARFHTTEVESSRDMPARDIAVVALPECVVADFLPDRQFLTMADVEREPRATEGIYAVVGHPNAWYRNINGVQKTDGLCFLATPYQGETNPDTLFDPTVYLALDFDQNMFDAFSGEEKQVPAIEGMSGCGLWRIVGFETPASYKIDIDNWSAAKVRLVGIQHARSKTRPYIRGTWIDYGISLILEQYPALRKVAQLEYPRGY